MCLAIPAKIIEIEDLNNGTGKYARVEVMGLENEVNIQLIEHPRAGDYLLVHAGCAIQKIDTDYFDYLSDFYRAWLENLERAT